MQIIWSITWPLCSTKRSANICQEDQVVEAHRVEAHQAVEDQVVEARQEAEDRVVEARRMEE